jgi:deoxyribonuclease V
MRAEASSPSRFPYIPGLFALREAPPPCEVFHLVRPIPDLLIAHGHVYAHPRRVGMATHLGAILGVPTIGVAGNLLRGMDSEVPGRTRGSRSAIYMDGEVVVQQSGQESGHVRSTCLPGTVPPCQLRNALSWNAP